MIVADKKPIEEIIQQVEAHRNVLILGCNECVTVCEAGGKKEVGILASALRMYFINNGKDMRIDEITLERQCDPEYVEQLVPYIDQADAVLSLACGCGVQEIARRFKDKMVFPGVNTKFMGASERPGVWAERCQGCGDCLLGVTGGICPIARCSKRLQNGPCGGSSKGKCEISPDVDCVWQLIWDRLKALGLEERYEAILPAKDWRSGRGGGPRKIVREDLM